MSREFEFWKAGQKRKDTKMGQGLRGILESTETGMAETVAGVVGGAIGLALGAFVGAPKEGAAIGAGGARYLAGQVKRGGQDVEGRLKQLASLYGTASDANDRMRDEYRSEDKAQQMGELVDSLSMAWMAHSFIGAKTGPGKWARESSEKFASWAKGESTEALSKSAIKATFEQGRKKVREDILNKVIQEKRMSQYPIPEFEQIYEKGLDFKTTGAFGGLGLGESGDPAGYVSQFARDPKTTMPKLQTPSLQMQQPESVGGMNIQNWLREYTEEKFGSESGKWAKETKGRFPDIPGIGKGDIDIPSVIQPGGPQSKTWGQALKEQQLDQIGKISKARKSVADITTRISDLEKKSRLERYKVMPVGSDFANKYDKEYQELIFDKSISRKEAKTQLLAKYGKRLDFNPAIEDLKSLSEGEINRNIQRIEEAWLRGDIAENQIDEYLAKVAEASPDWTIEQLLRNKDTRKSRSEHMGRIFTDDFYDID